MKRLVIIIMTLAIACQSIPLNIFANNAEISGIMSSATGNIRPASENEEEIPYYEDGFEDSEEYYNDSFDDQDTVPENNHNDYYYLNETSLEKISRLLNIDNASAERMILAYDNEDDAVYEAENYRMLKEMFYALDYTDCSDVLTELVVSGFGSLRVAYSGIVADVLDADIHEVMLRDDELMPGDDIYAEYFVQDFYVSPKFISEYTFEHGITAEVMYDIVMTSLRAMYPDVYSISTLSNDPNEKTPEYPSSPFFVNSGENESISPVSGALTYIMNLATIPGINGMDINLSLRYDSDKSVAQGKYRVTGCGYEENGTVINHSNHNYEPFVWEDKSPFMFGTGWRLNYDYIYRRDDQLYLELSDGREYKISGTSPSYILTGYNTKSLTLTGSGSSDSAYTLTFADGTVETFGSDGVLTSITDRFGNKLLFTHSKISKPVDESNPNRGTYTDCLCITDTHTTVLIEYNLTTECITLPDGSTIVFSYTYRNNDYLLTEITDQNGMSTTLTYQRNLCGLDDYDISYINDHPYTYFYKYQKLYYNYLTRILYPTGASTVYSYEKSSSETYVTYLVNSREDKAGDSSYNHVTFSYDIEKRNSTADHGKKTVEYVFDEDGFVTKETTKSGDNVKEWIEKVYDKNLGLPTKVTTAFTSPSYGTYLGEGIWSDGHGHEVTYPVYDTTSYFTKVDTYQYDSIGQITNQVVNDITTTNSYDSKYHLLRQSVSSGDDGKTVKTVNTLSADGKSVSSSKIYDNNVLSGRTDYTYDSHGNITVVKKYTGSTKYISTNNKYSDNGWIISSSTSGVTIKYTYDPMGRVTSETDGNGNITQYQHDPLGRIISETYPNGAAKAYSYTVQSGKNQMVVTDELGYTTTYNYNGLGDILSVYSGDQLIETTEYDSYRRVSSKIDANGATAEYSYDYADRVTQISTTDSINGVPTYNEQYTYVWIFSSQRLKTQKTVVGDVNSPSIITVSQSDVYGNTVLEGVRLDSSERLSQYTYDSFRNKISELTAKDKYEGLSFTYKYTYDINGNITSTCNSQNQYTYATYDWLGNMLSETDLLGNTTTYTYDAFGNVLTKTVPLDAGKSVTITYNYDKNGNLISEEYPVSGDTVISVVGDDDESVGNDEGGSGSDSGDNNGNGSSDGGSGNEGGGKGEEIPLPPPVKPPVQTISLNSETDDLQKITYYAYDNMNNLLEVKTYTSSSEPIVTATYTYDAKGQMLTSTTGKYTTEYSYDAHGNVADIKYPGGGIETFKYNAANNVIESTDRNGVMAKYTYNSFGNPLTITAGGKTISYEYTATGSLLSETSENGTTSYKYDSKGRKISETSAGTTINYAYDLADNILSISVNGSTTYYTYDSLNRLVKVVNGSSVAEYLYDNAGRRISTRISDDLGTISTTSYAYNYTGSITSLYNYDWSGDLISQFTYTYDTNGNVLTEYDSAANKTTTYTYDIFGRLVSEIGGGSSRYYTYDVAGNRQKAIVDTTTIILYNYDSDGRLISENRSNGQMGTSITYSYDANGNLISKSIGVKKTTYSFDVWGNMISGAKGTYTYNAQGLRTSKTVNGETIDFTLVGGNVWSDGTYNYVWGAELITNGSVYYVYNAHGDVIQLLDAEGNLVKTYDYDAYGNELTRDQNDENPFRYCGEYYDTETGFIYLRARYYDPNTGRFISVDPAHDGLNWYAYCGGDPVNYWDYTGCYKTKLQKFLEFALLLQKVVSFAIGDICAFANIGATSNRIDAYDEDFKYIYGQDELVGKDFFLRDASKSACEVIAVYNAMIYLGCGRPFEEVKETFQRCGVVTLGFGWVGSNAFSINRVLRDYGLTFEMTTPSQMGADGGYIISYWNEEDKAKYHTVFVVYENGKARVYNEYKDDTKTYSFDISKYADNFICGYYLGKDTTTIPTYTLDKIFNSIHHLIYG